MVWVLLLESVGHQTERSRYVTSQKGNVELGTRWHCDSGLHRVFDRGGGGVV